MTARCEMLLSPGTVISVSIRGARLIRRSSMECKERRSPATREGEEKNPKLRANVQHDTRAAEASSAPCSREKKDQLSLGNEKDFVRIGITHFGSRRETTDIDVALVGRIGAGDKAGLVRHRNAIGNVALGLLDRSRCRGNFRRGRRLRRGVIGGAASELVAGRVAAPADMRSGGGWYSGPMTRRRLWLGTGSDKQGREERERDRSFSYGCGSGRSCHFSNSFVRE